MNFYEILFWDTLIYDYEFWELCAVNIYVFWFGFENENSIVSFRVLDKPMHIIGRSVAVLGRVDADAPGSKMEYPVHGYIIYVQDMPPYVMDAPLMSQYTPPWVTSVQFVKDLSKIE